MTKEYLRNIEVKLMEYANYLDPKDMVAQSEVPVAVSRKMREVRTKARGAA